MFEKQKLQIVIFPTIISKYNSKINVCKHVKISWQDVNSQSDQLFPHKSQSSCSSLMSIKKKKLAWSYGAHWKWSRYHTLNGSVLTFSSSRKAKRWQQVTVLMDNSFSQSFIQPIHSNSRLIQKQSKSLSLWMGCWIICLTWFVQKRGFVQERNCDACCSERHGSSSGLWLELKLSKNWQ